MTQNTIVFFFPVCSICSASDGDCDWCEGTGFDPLPGHMTTRDPVIVGNGVVTVLTPIGLPDHMFPPPRPTAELVDDGSGVYFRDEHGKVRHIAAA